MKQLKFWTRASTRWIRYQPISIHNRMLINIDITRTGFEFMIFDYTVCSASIVPFHTFVYCRRNSQFYNNPKSQLYHRHKHVHSLFTGLFSVSSIKQWTSNLEHNSTALLHIFPSEVLNCKTDLFLSLSRKLQLNYEGRVIFKSQRDTLQILV